MVRLEVRQKNGDDDGGGEGEYHDDVNESRRGDLKMGVKVHFHGVHVMQRHPVEGT